MSSRAASPRFHTDKDQMIPVFLIRAVIALIASVLAIATFATLTDRPLEATPPAAPVSAEASVILMSDGMTGAVEVLYPDGTPIVALSPEDGGFIAGVHRVILRERALRRIAEDTPVTIRALENGRVAVHDPSTGWGADLMAFGTGNADAFARLLATIKEGRP